MLPTTIPQPALSAAAETAGNSTLLLLLMSHLQQRGLLDAAALAEMVVFAEANTRRDTPLLAGSAVVSHTLAWLQAQDG